MTTISYQTKGQICAQTVSSVILFPTIIKIFNFTDSVRSQRISSYFVHYLCTGIEDKGT